MNTSARIVITGIGLTSPLGNNLATFRSNLLESKCGLTLHEIRYMNKQVVGFCDFDETKYQTKKALRRGTRAGSIAVYCANEAIQDAQLNWAETDKSSVGIFLGITEHGNVETEQEIFELHQNKMDLKLWSHHHNPRTVANSPAGEVSLNLGIHGPHYTIGAACAGGNAGIIQGLQMLRLGEVNYALAGGVSESPRSFGIFAGFAAQGALAPSDDPHNAIKPLDSDRQGTVISEGGCVYLLERLDDALARGAKIYGEIIGHALNSDAADYVNPLSERQFECMKLAMKRAQLCNTDIDIVNMHATGTGAGDISEVQAVKEMFSESSQTYINFTKGHIGHCMGAAGALELAGNLPSFTDDRIHPGIGLKNIDPSCYLPNLVYEKPVSKPNISVILNNSFGMMGINSTVIVKKYN
jgi:3-oxoacyl-[acyl-carrier-protein] synthase II